MLHPLTFYQQTFDMLSYFINIKKVAQKCITGYPTPKPVLMSCYTYFIITQLRDSFEASPYTQKFRTLSDCWRSLSDRRRDRNKDGSNVVISKLVYWLSGDFIG